MENEYDSWYLKVLKIAKHRYLFDEEVINVFTEHLERMFENGYTPRRAVEVIAIEIHYS